GRTRTFAALVPVCLGIAASLPAVLAVGDHLDKGAVKPSTVHTATLTMFAAAVAVGLLTGLGALIQTRAIISQATRTRVHQGITAVAIATLVVVVVAGLVAAGNPVTRVKDSWNSFKGG